MCLSVGLWLSDPIFFFRCKVDIISTLTLILWLASHPSSSWTVNKIYLIFSNGLIIYVLWHYGNTHQYQRRCTWSNPMHIDFFPSLSTIKNMSFIHITTRSTWFQLLFCVNKLLFEDWKFPAEMVNKLKCLSEKKTLCSHFKLVKISFTSGRAEQRARKEDDENVTYEWSRFNTQKPMIKSVVWCLMNRRLVTCNMSFDFVFFACLSSLNLANS